MKKFIWIGLGAGTMVALNALAMPFLARKSIDTGKTKTEFMRDCVADIGQGYRVLRDGKWQDMQKSDCEKATGKVKWSS